FQVPVEEAAEPAAFRSPQDAGPAAEAEDPEGEAEIAVYPFYRDGAFLVARFDITNTGDRLSATSDFYGDRRGGFPEFSVQDPASGTIYRQARLGGTGDDRYLLGNEPWPVVLDPGLPNHGVAYFTAPPGDLTEAVFDAGPFGKLTAPVEEGRPWEHPRPGPATAPSPPARSPPPRGAPPAPAPEPPPPRRPSNRIG